MLDVDLFHAVELTETLSSAFEAYQKFARCQLLGAFLSRPRDLTKGLENSKLEQYTVTVAEGLAVRAAPDLRSNLIGMLPKGFECHGIHQDTDLYLGTKFAVREKQVVGSTTRWLVESSGWVGPLAGLAELDPYTVLASPEENPVQPSTWACTFCTFVNDGPSDGACSICGLRERSDDQTWTCDACTFAGTSLDAYSCSVCGSPRPGEVAEDRGACSSAECPFAQDENPCTKFAAGVHTSRTCTYCGCPAEIHTLSSDDARSLSDADRKQVLAGFNPLQSLPHGVFPTFQKFVRDEVGQRADSTTQLCTQLTGSGPHDLLRHIAAHIHALVDITSECKEESLEALNDQLKKVCVYNFLLSTDSFVCS